MSLHWSFSLFIFTLAKQESMFPRQSCARYLKVSWEVEKTDFSRSFYAGVSTTQGQESHKVQCRGRLKTFWVKGNKNVWGKDANPDPGFVL